MLTAIDIYNQINCLTGQLIKTGLCDAQNFPTIKKYSGNIEEIGITNGDYSVFLKNIPYSEMFKVLNEHKLYNIKMIDGALISMMYRFRNNQIISHRLSFFPSPNLEIFQNDPEPYLEDEIYCDILDKRIVTVPIRFDFDNRDEVCKPVVHPISHLTLGQYKNCRIPVAAAITPYQFLSFIIINFYHTAHMKHNNEFSIYKDCFEITLFEEEQELLHIHTPLY